MPVAKQDIANNPIGPTPNEATPNEATPNEATALRHVLTQSACRALAVDVAGRPYFRYRRAADGDRASRPGRTFVRAPCAGTVSWALGVGDGFAAGDELGALAVLDKSRPIVAGGAGRIAALLVAEGDLVGHGAALAAMEPSAESDGRAGGCL